MKDFSQFIDELTEKVTSSSPQLIRAMVELTYGCNLRCVHCYNPTHQARNELPTPEVLRILDELAELGCLWVGFTGGELFTRRDAIDIMQYAKTLGMVVTIVTNATLITPALAEEIKSLEPFQVDVSLYGATAETYERVTGVPGSYAQFVQGIDALRQRQVRIMLKLVLMNLNVHQWPEMKRFAIQRGLPYKITTGLHPRMDGSQEPLAYRVSPEQAFDIWRAENYVDEPAPAYLKGDRAGEEPADPCGSAGKLFDCACGKTNAAVTPYGKMNLCVSMPHPMYDLRNGSVKTGWETLVDTVASARIGPEYECLDCTLAQNCSRGSVDGWLEKGAFDAACLPYYRDIAERKTQFLFEEKWEV